MHRCAALVKSQLLFLLSDKQRPAAQRMREQAQHLNAHNSNADPSKGKCKFDNIYRAQ